MEFEYYRLYMLNRPIDEIFKRVYGFGRYLASNYGLIYDTKTGKLSSQYLYCDTNNNKKKYYYRVNLIDDLGIKRCARSSRIILMAFDSRPNYDNLEVHHIDEIHQICKYIVEGYSNDEIYNKFGFEYPKGNKEKLNILEILRRIKSKERFNRISDLYF